MYNTVLAALDLGVGSEVVLRKAIKFAKETKAELIIAHVQPIIVPVVASESVTINTGGLTKLTDEERDTLERYRKLAINAAIKDVKVVVEYSVNIVSTLVDEIAAKEKADLIICGSSNTHGITGFLLGSVSSGIAKHAKCDVFVVKDEFEE